MKTFKNAYVNISKLHISHKSNIINVLEFRKNGVIWLLSNDFDGYRVIGYFSDLTKKQQNEINAFLLKI